MFRFFLEECFHSRERNRSPSPLTFVRMPRKNAHGQQRLGLIGKEGGRATVVVVGARGDGCGFADLNSGLAGWLAGARYSISGWECVWVGFEWLGGGKEMEWLLASEPRDGDGLVWVVGWRFRSALWGLCSWARGRGLNLGPEVKSMVRKGRKMDLEGLDHLA